MAAEAPRRRTYSWGAGASYPVAPGKVATEIRRLEKRAGHSLNAKEFVAAARDPKSVLHALLPFDRTDKDLAQAYLEQVAGDVIRHLKISFIAQESRTVTIRAMINVASGGRRGFMPIELVLASKDLSDQMLSDALRDAETYCRRFVNTLIACGQTARADRVAAGLAILFK